jgi:hypothetical protein
MEYQCEYQCCIIDANFAMSEFEATAFKNDKHAICCFGSEAVIY